MEIKTNSQSILNANNARFWNEICGNTSIAKRLNIQGDFSANALKAFDKNYFDYYPYLQRHVNPKRMIGKKVLEVGLGYGTLGQKIAEEGADYLGLDIAPKPVELTNHRLKLLHLQGKAICDNILNPKLPSETFDYIVSIGCFHHTGDVQKCVDNTYRLLKRGGIAIVMVYNKHAFRHFFKTLIGILSNKNSAPVYDANSDGLAAPETAFLSIKQLKKIFGQFSSVKFTKENFTDIPYVRRYVSFRKFWLPTLGRLMGDDIYIEAKK